MIFALLGIDEEALLVVRELARSDEHSLRYFAPATNASEVAHLIAKVQRLAPLAEVLADWEYLLAPQGCDAVILAGPQGASERFEQMRRFIQEGIPLFVTHPPPVSLLEAYELEMVRQETRSIVISILPWHWYTWATWWAYLALIAQRREGADPVVGRVDQITWQRYLKDRSRNSVLAQFARDVDFIRQMCGEVTQIAALGATLSGRGLDAPDYSVLSVQMTGPAGVLIRWSVEDSDDTISACITVAGDKGKHRLEIEADHPADTSAIHYFPPETFDPELLDDRTFGSKNLPTLMAEQLRVAQYGDVPKHSEAHPSWPEAIRSLELVEAVEKSLRKGRTISVGVEGRTESDAFKGTMASVGCVLLIVGLLVVIGSAVMLKIAEKVGNQTLVNIFKWWPALLVGIFGVFLVLQLLRFIIPKSGGNPSSSRRDGKDGIDA